MLNLSVNDVVPPVVDYAQPSGTFTTYRWSGDVYGTNTWLSGMSPGSLTSLTGAAVGTVVDEVAVVDVALVDVADIDVAVIDVAVIDVTVVASVPFSGDEPDADEEPPPQPTRAALVIREIDTTRNACPDMPSTVRNALLAASEATVSGRQMLGGRAHETCEGASVSRYRS